ncbi:hypothetical protein CEXT_177041 [Caerostris extrusa]|uniref:Uncharacterized protein n=1 Tax=Caerostris extrusa TaxID=172846 RepID=A0AAV4N780_CAEEX|nr:hypothetical protein CEXT_177041 [Caerostris extrusa]
MLCQSRTLTFCTEAFLQIPFSPSQTASVISTAVGIPVFYAETGLGTDWISTGKNPNHRAISTAVGIPSSMQKLDSEQIGFLPERNPMFPGLDELTHCTSVSCRPRDPGAKDIFRGRLPGVRDRSQPSARISWLRDGAPLDPDTSGHSVSSETTPLHHPLQARAPGLQPLLPQLHLRRLQQTRTVRPHDPSAAHSSDMNLASGTSLQCRTVSIHGSGSMGFHDSGTLSEQFQT